MRTRAPRGRKCTYYHSLDWNEWSEKLNSQSFAYRIAQELKVPWPEEVPVLGSSIPWIVDWEKIVERKVLGSKSRA